MAQLIQLRFQLQYHSVLKIIVSSKRKTKAQRKDFRFSHSSFCMTLFLPFTSSVCMKTHSFVFIFYLYLIYQSQYLLCCYFSSLLYAFIIYLNRNNKKSYEKKKFNTCVCVCVCVLVLLILCKKLYIFLLVNSESKGAALITAEKLFFFQRPTDVSSLLYKIK